MYCVGDKISHTSGFTNVQRPMVCVIIKIFCNSLALNQIIVESDKSPLQLKPNDIPMHDVHYCQCKNIPEFTAQFTNTIISKAKVQNIHEVIAREYMETLCALVCTLYQTPLFSPCLVTMVTHRWFFLFLWRLLLFLHFRILQHQGLLQFYSLDL